MSNYFIICPFCADLCIEKNVHTKPKGRIELFYKCQNDNCNALIYCSKVKE